MALSHSSTCFFNLKVHKTDYVTAHDVRLPSSWWRRRVFFPPKPRLLRSLAVKNSAAAPELVVQHGKKTTLTITTTTSDGVCNHDDKKVPVFVMLPLDTVTGGGELKDRGLLESGLSVLKRSGVEGVMVDAWWGLVENEAPLSYKWGPYVELVRLLQSLGLKLQIVMSFHQCGGNVGDSCSIPLPQWVREEIDRNQDLVYTDRSGRRNPEYISLGCDSLPVLRGRTPIQVYTDFMKSFRQKFQDYFGNVIVEVQVGMGPCGELRYPSYPESNGIWRFPGIGEFQCYDKYMRASLAESAQAIGNRDWGHSGPHDAGEYNQFPEETGFFRRDGNWNTDYGHFFLSWYSGQLLSHGEALLAAARESFAGIAGLKISGKIAGIHWHYGTRSHAPELTAGYYNTRFRDGYRPIAEMFSRYGAVFNFTCVEMRDAEQKPEEARCSPEGLVRQVKAAVREAGIELAGENALERYDPWAYGRVLETAAAHDGGLCSFTYLRMNDQLLLNGDNLANFAQFVDRMSDCRQNSRREMSFSLM